MSAMKGLLAGRGSDCKSLVVALGLSNPRFRPPPGTERNADFTAAKSRT